MYKIIYNGIIIDVIDNPNYVRYIPRKDYYFPTDRTSANGVRSSAGDTYYHVEGFPEFPKHFEYKTIKMVEIDEIEYQKLRSQITENEIVCLNDENPSEEDLMKHRIEKLEMQVSFLIKQNKLISEELRNKFEGR